MFRKLLENEHGEKEELEKLWKECGLSPEEIDDEYRKLNLTGVIQQGYDGLGKLRFGLTSFGKDYCNSCLTFNDINSGLEEIKAGLKK